MRKGPIGISGLAGSGKDTLADIFLYILGEKAVKYSFASPIKKIMEIFGFTKKQMTDRVLKESMDAYWGVTPRWLAQTIGTEMFRKLFREDVWVRLGERFIKNNHDGITIIPDVRFDNEAELIQKYDGVVIQISRREAGLEGSAAKHSSENGISGHLITGTINNDGDFENLIDMALNILKSNRYVHPHLTLDSDTVHSLIDKLQEEQNGIWKKV